jgi:hypothetical protein
MASVSTKDWKLISYSGDFVCSVDCVLEWIKTQENVQGAPWKGHVKIITDAKACFRSDYELHFAWWLNANDITWFFECVTFQFKGKSYTPDFYLPAYGVFIETKGRWGLGQKSKMVAFREAYPTVPLLVVPWTLAKEFNRRNDNDPSKRLRM